MPAPFLDGSGPPTANPPLSFPVSSPDRDPAQTPPARFFLAPGSGAWMALTAY